MAKLIDASSEKTILLEDNLFYLPATATERHSTHDCELRPAQATNDTTNDYLFIVPASHSEFTSLADIRFMCDLVVTPPGGAAFVDTTHNFAPINNILHSLFESVTIELNGRTISDTSKMYFMRVYLESLLGYSRQTQKSQLTCAGSDLDNNLEDAGSSYGALSNTNLTMVVKNMGAKFRRNLVTTYGSPIQLSGKLHCDLFQQDKPLITGVEMQIKMQRARVPLTFCAATEADLPSLAIRNPRLLVRKYEPSPIFLNSVAKTLLTKTVKYHIERVAMRQTTFASGLQSSIWNNLACGQIPKTLIIGIVSSAGFNGSPTQTPFAFNHHNLAYISAEIDGTVYPSQGYNMDFTSNYSLQAYEGLLDTLERLNEPTGELVFDRLEYNKGYALYGFDFTVSHTGRGALSLIRNGN